MSGDKITEKLAESVDKRGVYRIYEAWPAYAEESLNRRAEIEGSFDRVFFLAVGGSAAAGDIISDWLLASGGPEFSVFKGVVPRAQLDRSLVIVCSASGNTEETLVMAEKAAKSRATIVTISSGGRVKQLSRKKNLRHFDIEIAAAPRYTLPRMLFTTLAILRGTGLLGRLEAELTDALASMRTTGLRIAMGVPDARNPAKRLAHSILGSVPKIYASSLARGAAVRFKNSLNENAKMHAYADSAPELFHNEVESWEGESDGSGSFFVPLLLRLQREPKRESEKLDALVEMLRHRGGGSSENIIQVRGEGRTRLGQLVSLDYELDFASYYTAILRRVDPYSVRAIDRLKSGFFTVT